MEANVKVHIPAHIYEEIDYYVQQTKDEISGLGRIVKDEDGTLRVSKIYLPKQENGPASTDLAEDAIATLMYESREDEGDLTFWWHSHNSMKAFWSGTDHATIEDLGKNGYVVATVFNHDREYKTAYYQGGNEFYPEVFIDNVDTTFHAMPMLSQINEWKKNVENAVSTKKWAVKRTWPRNKSVTKSKQTTLGLDLAGLNLEGEWEEGKTWCPIRQGWYHESELETAAPVETLADIIGYYDACQWEDLYIEHTDIEPYEIEDAKLIAYYKEHEGNYNKALTAVMANYETEL